jgi:hypothetical protein
MPTFLLERTATCALRIKRRGTNIRSTGRKCCAGRLRCSTASLRQVRNEPGHQTRTPSSLTRYAPPVRHGYGKMCAITAGRRDPPVHRGSSVFRQRRRRGSRQRARPGADAARRRLERCSRLDRRRIGSIRRHPPAPYLQPRSRRSARLIMRSRVSFRSPVSEAPKSGGH